MVCTSPLAWNIENVDIIGSWEHLADSLLRGYAAACQRFHSGIGLPASVHSCPLRCMALRGSSHTDSVCKLINEIKLPFASCDARVVCTRCSAACGTLLLLHAQRQFMLSSRCMSFASLSLARSSRLLLEEAAWCDILRA